MMADTYSSLPSWKYFIKRYGVILGGGSVVLVAILGFYIRDPRITEAVLASAVRQSTPLILGALVWCFGRTLRGDQYWH